MADDLLNDTKTYPRMAHWFDLVLLLQPKATRQAYANQLRQPYAWAAPDPDKKNDEGRPLLAIPGNHDCYDCLVLSSRSSVRRSRGMSERGGPTAPKLLRRPLDRDLVALGDRHTARRRHGRAAGGLLQAHRRRNAGGVPDHPVQRGARLAVHRQQLQILGDHGVRGRHRDERQAGTHNSGSATAARSARKAVSASPGVAGAPSSIRRTSSSGKSR
ncbi:hypothetical protein ACVJGD_004291 [Bradyrhizobium sp. USDA 10063]